MPTPVLTGHWGKKKKKKKKKKSISYPYVAEYSGGK